MRILACILPVIAGALQLLLINVFGKGVRIVDSSIDKLLYSGTMMLCLSVLLIVLGLSSLKFPKVSGLLLVVVATTCFFLGSVYCAPVAFAGGVLCHFVTSLDGAYGKRLRIVSAGFTLLAFLITVGSFERVIYLWNKQ